ncbi:MAG TPA: alpha/beta hydrolase [Anaerolineae bacterium]|nr:alpha/beta hydrolase [Anaerolineae bacterium]
MQQVTSKDGTTIGYRQSGSGPPLLLVHGVTADHTRWAPILPRFERDFTVYAMDRRGRGGSGDSPDYEFAREAEDVAAVVNAIGEPVSVLGHSGGAFFSLEAALRTDNMHRLILYEPPIPGIAPPVPTEIPDRIQALIDRGDMEAALEVFLREIVRMPEHELKDYRHLPAWKRRISIAPTIPRELVALTYRWDPEKFAGVRVPALLLLGGDSPPFARQAVEMVHAALPNSQIVVLPGQQHIAMDTDPELFAREVRRFLLG